MASIKFSKKLFEKEIGKLTEEMQNKIALFGTTLESITEDEMELDITPDRPDLLSYHGFKRAFLAFIGKHTGIKKYKLHKPEKNYEVKIESSLKNIRPYTACAIIKGLKLNNERIKEIIDIQEKLHNTLGRKRKKLAIGIYPLEKIKLPITFKALEPDKIRFRPLDSPREMSGLQILERHPTGREYAHLLAGKPKFPIFIDSNKNILSMPPIINSELTGKVTESTKEVFIECSGFDFKIISECLNILVTSLAEMGGKIYQMKITGTIKQTTPNLTPQKNKISVDNANSLLGTNLSEKQIKSLLEKMGHSYDTKSGIVESPAWRTDILHEVDLIEEIAIAYGYENFIPEIPEISTIGEENPEESFKRKIIEIISGVGITEVSNYHLTTKNNQLKNMGINIKQEKPNQHYVELEDSKTENTILRKDLSHYLLKNLSENADAEYPQKLAEIGRVFCIESNDKKKIKENENLAIAFAPGNFTEIRQAFEYLFRMLGIKDKIKLEEPAFNEIPNHFIEGRVAKIKLNEKDIGFIGEIHPKILKNWKIKMPVALGEISLKSIFEILRSEII